MKFATGVDDFKKLRERHYTYVDKSLFIEEVIENAADVQLITRPRRFGKTLNMSMLAYFFDTNENNSHLFKGLEIEARPCFEELGTRPLIFVSFKKLKAIHFDEFLDLFAGLMSDLFKKYKYLMDHLDEFDLEDFRKIAGKKAGKSLLSGALAQLTLWLEQHHGKKVVLLIDEYDSPIDEAYNAGYYEPMITFMRGTLGSALKGNTSLHKGVLTGILRISKESIFSDLNNLRVYTVMDPLFGERFGFLEDEVVALLEEAGRSDRLEEIRNWYNGYKVGNAIVYNPWSVIGFLEDPIGECQTYWVNTSSNNLIFQLLTSADAGIQETLTNLINGKYIETPIYSQTTLRDLDEEALWSLLLYSGYLTTAGQKRQGDESIYSLKIPNAEVRQLYKTIFHRFVVKRMGRSSLMKMLNALTEGNMEIFEIHFAKLVWETLSFYDTARDKSERFYHAFVLGLLANLDYRYHIRSNRESGYGRYDLMMTPKDLNDRGVIIEFKVSDSPESLDEDAQTALDQIGLKKYPAELEAQGVRAYSQIGIAFCGKSVKVIGQ